MHSNTQGPCTSPPVRPAGSPQRQDGPVHRQPAPEFEHRVAVACIRAADAGVIDADELAWLLEALHARRPEL
jgi:uncharacterized membrane protein YebE (DUF533 family)